MRTLKALLAATTLAVLPTAAHAQWYLGADAGAGYTNSDISGNNITVRDDDDWGFVGLGQLGYSFGAPKVELEGGYRSGDVSAWSAMVNGIYDFMPTGKWHPFVGAGIGWAWVDTDTLATNTAGVTVNDGYDAFAYQGFLGVAYDVTADLAVKAQYRYFATLEEDLKASNGTKVDGDYDNHSILVGLTYKFNKPAPAPVAAPAPAPVAAPAPPPPPKPAVVQKNFMVFFDWDKADIKPEAQAIISQAVQTAKAGNSARVNLTGHADRSGPDKYNMALSLKRANNVKAAMVKQGIPADQIAVVGKGESEPLVATPDGVREPQNRRVEIVLP